MGITLPAAPWRARSDMDPLLAALGADTEQSRYVGGAVRDTLLGLDVSDVDIATRLLPEDAMHALKRAGIKAVPTGIAHGTITAILPEGPVEVTTLRRDVSTDGRHATIAFSNDWREDAARRDFTINALYANPLTSEIYDFFDGVSDLNAGRVRFIGDALTRIAEDHLRILRFFRFHARFGKAAPDALALEACRIRSRDLMALSRERIADEFLKLLGLPNPAPIIQVMLDNAIWASVIPEIGTESVARLQLLYDHETHNGADPDALRRLIALIGPNAASADQIAARLKLSNAQRKRIATALSDPDANPFERLYRWGPVAAGDSILLSSAPDTEIAAIYTKIQAMQRPILPISGGALVKRGLVAGPLVAKTLRDVEDQWIAEGFPDEERVNAIADNLVDQALRAQR